MARIVDVFPRRPLRLARDRKRTTNRILLLVAAVLVSLPALYWGSIAWQATNCGRTCARAASARTRCST